MIHAAPQQRRVSTTNVDIFLNPHIKLIQLDIVMLAEYRFLFFSFLFVSGMSK